MEHLKTLPVRDLATQMRNQPPSLYTAQLLLHEAADRLERYDASCEAVRSVGMGIGTGPKAPQERSY